LIIDMSVGIATGGAMRARAIGRAINIGVLSTNGAFYLLVCACSMISRLLARPGPSLGGRPCQHCSGALSPQAQMPRIHNIAGLHDDQR
jgi:hypothetical protein